MIARERASTRRVKKMVENTAPLVHMVMAKNYQILASSF